MGVSQDGHVGLEASVPLACDEGIGDGRVAQGTFHDAPDVAAFGNEEIVNEKVGALAQALGFSRDRARFFLKGVINKFGLGEEGLVHLARHQVKVMGLKDHLESLPGVQVQPGLDVPGKQDLQADGSLEHAPVGEAFGMKAYQHAL